ncbi:MAG TPA: hypothetical protein VEL73_07010 [Mycobacteriales bacterium]|nr:hypothetical protein [Mycobacteriales bacterium]
MQAAYRRFWAVATTVERQPPRRWRAALATVAIDPFLTRLLEGFRAQRARGLRQYGTVSSRPTVVDLSTDRASIVDCQDASRSGEADLDSGLPRTVGAPRTPFAATLVRGSGRVWRLADARYLAGSC